MSNLGLFEEIEIGLGYFNLLLLKTALPKWKQSLRRNNCPRIDIESTSRLGFSTSIPYQTVGTKRCASFFFMKFTS